MALAAIATRMQVAVQRRLRTVLICACSASGHLYESRRSPDWFVACVGSPAGDGAPAGFRGQAACVACRAVGADLQVRPGPGDARESARARRLRRSWSSAATGLGRDGMTGWGDAQGANPVHPVIPSAGCSCPGLPLRPVGADQGTTEGSLLPRARAMPRRHVSQGRADFASCSARFRE